MSKSMFGSHLMSQVSINCGASPNIEIKIRLPQNVLLSNVDGKL